MKSFEYGDREVGGKEIAFGVASMIIGIGILNLPRSVAQATRFGDGVFSILFGGIAALVLAFVAGKLAARFPKQNFFQFTARIATKPVAYLLTLVFALYMGSIAVLDTRAIGNIAKLYMFDRTPVEVLSLCFLLVVVYAAAGSSAGLLRLNMMFLPLILLVAIGVPLMNISFFEFKNLRPLFTTDLPGMMTAALESAYSLLGFEIVLFYGALVNRPKKIPKYVVYGMAVPVVVYALIYVFAIAVFSNPGTSNIVYPTIEMAKEVEIPGEFFERFESLFFTIWIMTIFNTTAMAFDLAVHGVRAVFPKVKKIPLVLGVTPVIYLLSMMPEGVAEIGQVAGVVSVFGVIFSGVVPGSLLLISVIRGVKGDA